MVLERWLDLEVVVLLQMQTQCRSKQPPKLYLCPYSCVDLFIPLYNTIQCISQSQNGRD